jgi:hypothetical protein
MHKTIRLQLPDLRILSIRVDFSVSVFASVCKLCKDLGKNKNLFLNKNFCFYKEFVMLKNFHFYVYQKFQIQMNVVHHHVVDIKI